VSRVVLGPDKQELSWKVISPNERCLPPGFNFASTHYAETVSIINSSLQKDFLNASEKLSYLGDKWDLKTNFPTIEFNSVDFPELGFPMKTV
jgi:hypothetical protein